MQVLFEVMKELGQFAFESVASLLRSRPAAAQLIAPPPRLSLPLSMTPQLLGSGTTPDEVDVEAVEAFTEPETESFRSVATVIEERNATAAHSAPASVLNTGGRQYLTAATPLFQNPTKEFDAVLAVLPYGGTVTVLEERSRWTHVKYDGLTGWVERSELTQSFAAVRPFFVLKERCTATSEATKRLRALIADAFGGERALLPLQPEEYVYYRLQERGLDIPVIATRPRRAGSWQKLFAGIRGVHIGVRPKTGAIMEYIDADEVGHLAYVEAVFPDESLSCSEIGDPEEGFYSERVLEKEAWQALAPVFLQFS
jgi:hypothetical protein